jgi:acyl transferase domain-containing protein
MQDRLMTAKTVFMFSGQGSQYFQMGKQLFETSEVFRHWMIRLDKLAREMAGMPVIDAVYASPRTDSFDRTLKTHPAIFILEYSLARCLIGDGIEPDLVLGASLGSFAAAAVAGHLDVEDALAAVVQQAIALEETCQRGGMIAVLAGRELFEQDWLRGHAELAADNFATHFALAAPQARLDEIEEQLRARGLAHQRLAMSFAFHSRWIDPARASFEAFMHSVPRGRGHLPLVCCEQAAVLTDLPDDFFWRAVRRPIRLRDTIAQLESQGPHRYIDVGPSGTMATFAKYALPAGSASTVHPALTPYGQDLKNMATLRAAFTGPAVST